MRFFTYSIAIGKTTSGQSSASTCKTGVFLFFNSVRLMGEVAYESSVIATPPCKSALTKLIIDTCYAVRLLAIKAREMIVHKQAKYVCAAG